MSNLTLSKAMTEVWEWKEIAYQEVKNLSIKDALRKRIEDSIKTAESLGFKSSVSIINEPEPNPSRRPDAVETV